MRSVLSLVMLFILTAAGPLRAAETVHVVRKGQYYHRPSHLDVTDVRVASLEDAVQAGFDACPECTPPILVDRTRVVDPGISMYYGTLLEYRGTGELYAGEIVGRLEKPNKKAKEAERGRDAFVERARKLLSGTAGGAAQAAPPVPAAGAAAAAPDAGSVPGTGGLLKPLTFSGSGGGIQPTQTTYTGQAIPQPAAPSTGTGGSGSQAPVIIFYSEPAAPAAQPSPSAGK
jgi:hypothetical protein